MSGNTPETLDPAEVARQLEDGKVLLIDVREPAEYAAERIPGALLYPLSTFDASKLPPDGRDESYSIAPEVNAHWPLPSSDWSQVVRTPRIWAGASQHGRLQDCQSFHRAIEPGESPMKPYPHTCSVSAKGGATGMAAVESALHLVEL